MAFKRDLIKVEINQGADKNGMVVHMSQSETLLVGLQKNKIPIGNSCGGMGTCGTCRVIVLNNSESLLPREAIEQELAEDRGLDQFERLSCQIFPVDGLKIEIPDQGET